MSVKTTKGRHKLQRCKVAGLRELLERTRLTYREVGEAAGCSSVKVGNIKRGLATPTRQEAERMVQAIHEDIERTANLKDKVVERLNQTRRNMTGRYRGRRSELEVECSLNGDTISLTINGEVEQAKIREHPDVVTYLLLRDGEVVYVGHSTSVYWRLGHHEREKRFDSYAWIEAGTRERAKELERALLDKFDPEYNVL